MKSHATMFELGLISFVLSYQLSLPLQLPFASGQEGFEEINRGLAILPG